MALFNDTNLCTSVRTQNSSHICQKDSFHAQQVIASIHIVKKNILALYLVSANFCKIKIRLCQCYGLNGQFRSRKIADFDDTIIQPLCSISLTKDQRISIVARLFPVS